MSNINELTAKLKAAAVNATAGEWCADDYHGVVAEAGLNGNYYIASCSGPDHRSNKRFIALASPANVLALIDTLEAAEKRIAELEVNLRINIHKNCGRDIAAFRVDPNEGPSWLTFRCEEDLRENGLISKGDSVVPLSVIAQETPKKGEVLVTVSGFTGSGKSAIAGEIEIAMKAIGVPVAWPNGDAEKRMTGADWLTAIEMYNPSVRIVEVNVPRAAGIKLQIEGE